MVELADVPSIDGLIAMVFQARGGTHAERTLFVLRSSSGGMSDAELAKLLDLQHQTVNATCRQLAAAGGIRRVKHLGSAVIKNFANGGPRAETPPTPGMTTTLRNPSTTDTNRPWYWEGNVQSTVVKHLENDGWRILSAANTATRAAGKDLVAQRHGIDLWISVKGQPERTEKTQPFLQARHWFAGAIFDVVLWRQESTSALLGVALPTFTTYVSLAKRSQWLQNQAPFSYFWVEESGNVVTTPPGA